MVELGRFGDVLVSLDDDHVATVEICRPPNNFFSLAMIDSLVEAFRVVDADPSARAVLLCSQGKHFCAGADFATADPLDGERRNPDGSPRHLYDAAVELFSTGTPTVAAVQGAAIGGGLGLACFADFRVAAPEARFAANFARLGFHHGFGLSVTLPSLVGQQRALELLYTGRRVDGETAHRIGLADRIETVDGVRGAAHAMAAEIAASAPLAVASIRRTMRGELAARVRAATDREKHEQDWLRRTDDWREGVRAMSERRPPVFRGR